jgi:hypothetical protein
MTHEKQRKQCFLRLTAAMEQQAPTLKERMQNTAEKNDESGEIYNREIIVTEKNGLNWTRSCAAT